MSGLLRNLKYIKLYDVLSIFVFLLLIIPSLFYRLYLKITSKRVWLVAEDGRTARDNGYNFFKYMREEHKDFKAYYVIDKKSHDYKKVAKLGNIVKFRSIKHWIYYLSCEYNISSQKNGNPAQALFYVLHVKFNLFNNRVFLQHGITINEAKYIFYNETKFKYLTCGAKREYEYIKEKFGYPDGSLLLTGLARNDALLDNPKVDDKQILIMPSWRNWLGRETNHLTKQEPFTETEFYKNWNGLLNDKDFINFIETNNLKVKFYPHINMQKFLGDFKPGSKNIEIVSTETDIQGVIKKSAIMITDYSSASMDSALLKRPLAYFQFDQKEYRKKQYNPGFFSYEKDGFGPVTHTISETVDFIKRTFNGKKFEIQDEYLEKSDAFFTETEECSRKIYDNLLKSRKVPTRKEKIETALVYISLLSICVSALTFQAVYTITPVMIASVAIALYRICYKVKLKGRFYFYQMAYFAFLIFAIISSALFSFNPSESWKIFFKIAVLSFALLQYKVLYCEAGRERVKKAVCILSLLYLFVTFAFYFASLSYLNFNFNIPNIKLPGLMVDRKTPRLATLSNFDPNQSCVFLMIPYLYALCSYWEAKTKSEKTLRLITITGYLAAILLTFSRGGLIALTCAAAVFVLFNRLKLRRKLLILGVPAAIALASIVVVPAGFNYINSLNSATSESSNSAGSSKSSGPDNQQQDANNPFSPTTITDRFSKSIADKGSGRIRIWKKVINAIVERRGVGIGVGSTVSYGREHYGEHKLVHNAYLEVLFEAGPLAFVAFMVFVIAIMIKVFRIRKFDGAFSLTAMTSLFANCIFLSNQYNEIFFIHIMLVGVVLYFAMEKNRNIKASVIMPTLNTKDEYLKTSIESILNQTHQNFEFIIVADGGNDDKFITKQFKDDRISIIKHEKTKGIAHSLNEAIKQSTGEYIIRMDADDISEPRRIERQVAYMEGHPDIDVSSAFYVKFGNKHKITREAFTKPDDVKAKLFFMNTIAHPAVIARKSSVIDGGYTYDPSFERAEDYELWDRMVLDGRKISIMKSYVLFYRTHANQVGVAKREQQLAQVERIYERNLKKLGISSKNVNFVAMLGGQEKVSEKKALKKFVKNVLAANEKYALYPTRSLKKTLWSAYGAACIRSRIIVIPNMHFLSLCARKVIYRMAYNPIVGKKIKGYKK